MARPQVGELNVSTGEETIRDMTDDEFTKYQADQVAQVAANAATLFDQQAEQHNLADANKKMIALGFTQDDIVALLKAHA